MHILVPAMNEGFNKSSVNCAKRNLSTIPRYELVISPLLRLFHILQLFYPFIFKMRCSTNSLNAALNEPCSHNKRFYTQKRFQNGRYFRETRKCRTPRRRFISSLVPSEYFFRARTTPNSEEIKLRKHHIQITLRLL